MDTDPTPLPARQHRITATAKAVGAMFLILTMANADPRKPVD